MKLTTMLTSFAGAALALSPLAAQAGTKAASATPAVGAKIATAMAGSRASRSVEKKDNANAVIVGGAVIVAGVGVCAAAGCFDGNGDTPG